MRIKTLHDGTTAITYVRADTSNEDAARLYPFSENDVVTEDILFAWPRKFGVGTRHFQIRDARGSPAD